MVQATRTTNPLQFEALEPRRFEDLVRQLLYDFKTWRKLEATGRSGSDDGFDARGYEIVVAEGDDDRNEGDETADDGVNSDRIWLVQCKREKAITPKKLAQYLNEIPPESSSDLYGVVFAVACDFSKKTREAMSLWAREHGIAETHMWGKAELEDMLYQPKNDNLLFAYFGISLQIRKRSMRAALRARLAMKKRAETVLGKGWSGHKTVLLRDPTDDRYPYTEEPDKQRRGRWRVVTFVGQDTHGIRFEAKRHFAYVDDARKHWDIDESIDMSEPGEFENRWCDPKNSLGHHRSRDFWSKLPEKNRATYESIAIVRYEDILAIDDEGDEEAHCPHVYLEFGTAVLTRTKLVVYDQPREPIYSPDPADRIKFFPDVLPEPLAQEAEQGPLLRDDART